MSQAAAPPAAQVRRSSPDRRELTVAVIAVAAGGGLAVLADARAWSTVTVLRAAPLGPLTANVGGRTLQPAVTGLAVVALAGVLAMLATRGLVRQLVGAVLLLTGVGMIWRAALGLGSVSSAHGRQLVASSRTGATLGNVRAVHVSMHPVWALLAVLGGVLVVAGGAITTARGGRWRAMSARYESPVGSASRRSLGQERSSADPRSAAGQTAGVDTAGGQADEVARARADLALWLQLDRGEDPTAVEPEPLPASSRDEPGAGDSRDVDV